MTQAKRHMWNMTSQIDSRRIYHFYVIHLKRRYNTKHIFYFPVFNYNSSSSCCIQWSTYSVKLQVDKIVTKSNPLILSKDHYLKLFENGIHSLGSWVTRTGVEDKPNVIAVYWNTLAQAYTMTHCTPSQKQDA